MKEIKRYSVPEKNLLKGLGWIGCVSVVIASDHDAIVEELKRVTGQLEWLWANCRIVHYPGGLEYPLEHTEAAQKRMRVMIENCMPAEIKPGPT